MQGGCCFNCPPQPQSSFSAFKGLPFWFPFILLGVYLRWIFRESPFRVNFHIFFAALGDPNLRDPFPKHSSSELRASNVHGTIRVVSGICDLKGQKVLRKKEKKKNKKTHSRSQSAWSQPFTTQPALISLKGAPFPCGFLKDA